MSIKSTPLVSIIITTYKRSHSLTDAIKSTLNQTYSNIEVIVVDDNDPDTRYRKKTQQLMKQFENNNSVKYIQHNENKNGAAARNTGIEHSQGDYITYLDDDDQYFNDKVEQQVKFLQENLNYDGVYCGWREGDNLIIPKYEGDLTFYLLSGQVRIITNAIMVTKKSIIEFNGWDESFRRNQEAAFLLRFFKAGYKLGFVSDVLFKIDNEVSTNASNAVQNEEDFDYYLDAHKDQIKASSKKMGINKDVIYSYRYRGVLLRYLKHRDISGALKLYFKMIKKMPIRFNKDLLIYIIKKIQEKPLYS